MGLQISEGNLLELGSVASDAVLEEFQAFACHLPPNVASLHGSLARTIGGRGGSLSREINRDSNFMEHGNSEDASTRRFVPEGGSSGVESVSNVSCSAQEVNAPKKSIAEASSQAQVLLKEGRNFETASLPRGFEKELARLEVSHQRLYFFPSPGFHTPP
jgi:hypothetical protein